MAEDKKIVKVNKQSTRAQFKLNTFNEADRTIEVTFATETPTRSYDWEIVGGHFLEVLSCDPAHIRMDRINSKAPVLDNHDKYSSTRKAVVGVVEWAKIQDGVCVAKLRFSNSPDDTELMEKVRDGIVTGISVGYNVYAYQLTRSSIEGALDTYTAIDWEPTEISFVPVQADVNSRVRSEDNDTATEATVEEVVADPAPAPEPEPPVAEEPAQEENTDEPTPENNTNSNNNEMTEEEKKAQAAAENKTRSDAAKAERERISGIRKHTRALNLPESFADTLIEDDTVTDLAIAGQRALDEWEKLNPVNAKPNAEQQRTNDEKVRSAMSNALVLRINPQAAAVMGDENVRAAGEFKSMTFLRLAEESLIRSGVRTAGLTSKEIAKGALGAKVRGMHHTSDFPLLLGDTINRTLMAKYALQPRTFPMWARRNTMSDFRATTRVRVTDLIGDLELVREGAEYKYGTMGEGGESYKLDKYGKIISITWEAIVNDDLSAFTTIPQAFAAKAAQKQSNLVYAILTGNPAMSDGKALFHTDHKNYTGTNGNLTAGGTALSEASLTTALKLFRTQTADNGDFISVSPKYLIVGPELEFIAGKLTSTNFTPAKQTDVSIPAITGLIPIVDPRITGYTWFLAASPDAVDTVEYSFLDGEEELFIEQREGFNIDGVEIKARMVFAAKAIDWRGMYRNNGAASA